MLYRKYTQIIQSNIHDRVWNSCLVGLRSTQSFTTMLFYYIHMVKNVANVAGFRGLGVMIQTIENYKQNYMYTLIISAATFIVNKIGCEVLN